MKQLFHRMNLNLFRQNIHAEKELEEPTTAKAFSLPNWYVNAVADILVQKYGIRQVNTAEQYGNATESLKMVKVYDSAFI